MRHPTRYTALFLIAGCSSDDSATEEAVAATEPAVDAVAETTTEAPPTTTPIEAATTAAPISATAAQGPFVGEALVPAYLAEIRDTWARAERTVGGTAPDLSDEEIVAVGAAMCEYIAANPWISEMENEDPEETMPAFTELAAVAADAKGISYDPAMQDAGFDNGFDARLVLAFNQVADVPEDGAVPLFPGGVLLFHSPWSTRASD